MSSPHTGKYSLMPAMTFISRDASFLFSHSSQQSHCFLAHRVLRLIPSAAFSSNQTACLSSSSVCAVLYLTGRCHCGNKSCLWAKVHAEVRAQEWLCLRLPFVTCHLKNRWLGLGNNHAVTMEDWYRWLRRHKDNDGFLSDALNIRRDKNNVSHSRVKWKYRIACTTSLSQEQRKTDFLKI